MSLPETAQKATESEPKGHAEDTTEALTAVPAGS
jgi:hypothetical protein